MKSHHEKFQEHVARTLHDKPHWIVRVQHRPRSADDWGDLAVAAVVAIVWLFIVAGAILGWF